MSGICLEKMLKEVELSIYQQASENVIKIIMNLGRRKSSGVSKCTLRCTTRAGGTGRLGKFRFTSEFSPCWGGGKSGGMLCVQEICVGGQGPGRKCAFLRMELYETVEGGKTQLSSEATQIKKKTHSKRFIYSRKELTAKQAPGWGV